MYPYNRESTPEPMNKDNINFKEMTLLVSGWLRDQLHDNSIAKELAKMVLMQCEVLETFDGERERKIIRYAAGTMIAYCGNIYRKIESFAPNGSGYSHGVRYLSISFTKGGCTNDFGVINDDGSKGPRRSGYESYWTKNEPENHEIAANYDEYNLSFKDYGSGIVTIKLDCDNWMVTFYKNYAEILKKEKIEPNESYWFYVFYCNRAGQNFEIIRTDVEKINENLNE